ncbi:MAG: hypothetical protein ACOVOR_04830 [Rhabdochlamydiaceae bacterium]
MSLETNSPLRPLSIPHDYPKLHILHQNLNHKLSLSVKGLCFVISKVALCAAQIFLAVSVTVFSTIGFMTSLLFEKSRYRPSIWRQMTNSVTGYKPLSSYFYGGIALGACNLQKGTQELLIPFKFLFSSDLLVFDKMNEDESKYSYRFNLKDTFKALDPPQDIEAADSLHLFLTEFQSKPLLGLAASVFKLALCFFQFRISYCLLKCSLVGIVVTSLSSDNMYFEYSFGLLSLSLINLFKCAQESLIGITQFVKMGWVPKNMNDLSKVSKQANGLTEKMIALGSPSRAKDRM